MTEVQSNIPVFGSQIASLPKKERVSASRKAKFITSHYNNGLSARRQHAIAWVMVQSFLRGIHYFSIDAAGTWEPIPPEEGEKRAVVPVLRPLYRHVLGFFNSNPVGLTTVPVAGGVESIVRSDRSQKILTAWIDEARIREFQDRANQILLTEGTVGYNYILDPFREQVFMKALPGSEIFPIPYDARSPDELHGLIHATIVSKEWLELQDTLFERQHGQPPPKKMADKAQTGNLGLRLDLPMVGSAGSGGRTEGALVLTGWMRRTEETPFGEYFFLVGNELFRYSAGPETQLVMPNGEIPVEIVYFDKQPNDFWGAGLCESLVPGQLSADRHMTIIERNSVLNRPLTFYDSSSILGDDVQLEEDSFIPLTPRGLEVSRQAPVFHFPATSPGREQFAILELATRFSDQAAGLRSGVAFGQQEGRTESGPATTLLSQNAMSSFSSPMSRIEIAWKNLYPRVLDGLQKVWKPGKVIRVAGPGNIGRELKITKDQVPWSHQVIIHPKPLNAGGRQAQASLLFQLRKIPGQDGTPGTEISSREFRNALKKMNLLPEGIEVADKASARVQTRIDLLINDGQTPAIRPSDPKNPRDRMVMENHRLAIEMLKDVILDESWNTYGKAVQKALIDQIEFHRAHTFGAVEHPNNFDDDIEKQVSLQMENFLSAAAADLETPEGDFLAEIAAG